MDRNKHNLRNTNQKNVIQERLRQEDERDFIYKIYPAFLKAFNFITNPKETYEEIKKSSNVKDFLLNYWLFIAAVPSITFFISALFTGSDIFIGFWSCIINYVILVISLFIGGHVIKFFTSKFAGSIELNTAIQYYGYCATPGILAGILNLFPNFLFRLLNFGAACYGFYLFYIAIPWMTGIAKNKSLPFAASVIGSCIGLMFVFMIIFAFIT